MTSKLKRLIFGYDWEIVELQGSVLMAMWGLWLLLPWTTFSNSSNAYSGLSVLASENVWGIFLLTLGVVQFVCIASGNVRMRRLLIACAGAFWLFMTITVGIVRPSAGLIPFTLVTSFFLAVNYIRLGLPVVDRGRQAPR